MLKILFVNSFAFTSCIYLPYSLLRIDSVLFTCCHECCCFQKQLAFGLVECSNFAVFVFFGVFSSVFFYSIKSISVAKIGKHD